MADNKVSDEAIIACNRTGINSIDLLHPPKSDQTEKSEKIRQTRIMIVAN